MADFLVLRKWKGALPSSRPGASGVVTLQEGAVIDDGIYDVPRLVASGLRVIGVNAALEALLLQGDRGPVDVLAAAVQNLYSGAPGSGDVVGPGGATDNAIARYDAATGKVIQNSLVTITDLGSVVLAALQTVDGRDVSVDGAKLDGVETDAKDDQSSAEVPFTPNGDIAAANVQAAIVEVRDDTDTKLATKAAVSHVHDDTEVNLSGVIGTPTNTTVEDLHNAEGSVGVSTGGVITDDADGTITVSALTGMIRATDSDTAALLSFDVAETPLSPADVDISYIYAEYNGGTPRMVTTTVERSDHNTNTLLGTVYRDGTSLHLTPRLELIGNSTHLTNRRLTDTDNLSHVSGSAISETGTRKLAGTAGAYWLGLNEIATAAFDTNVADDFFYFYRDGIGGWTVDAVATTISNTQYDDGTGSLATLGANRYGVHWLYIGVDDHVYTLYGRGNYTLGGAEDALPPSDVPPHLQEHHGVLAAKIIVQKDAVNLLSIESAFGVKFSAAGIQDHGDLAGLADDDHVQYLRTDGTRALTGNIDANDNNLDNYQRARSNVEVLGTSGAISVDCDASVDSSCDPTGNITGITVSNKPGTGKAQMLRILFTQDTTPRTIPTSWTGVDWWTNAAGGPVMPTGSGKTMVVTIVITGGKKAVGSWVAEP